MWFWFCASVSWTKDRISFPQNFSTRLCFVFYNMLSVKWKLRNSASPDIGSSPRSPLIRSVYLYKNTPKKTKPEWKAVYVCGQTRNSPTIWMGKTSVRSPNLWLLFGALERKGDEFLLYIPKRRPWISGIVARLTWCRCACRDSALQMQGLFRFSPSWVHKSDKHRLSRIWCVALIAQPPHCSFVNMARSALTNLTIPFHQNPSNFQEEIQPITAGYFLH